MGVRHSIGWEGGLVQQAEFGLGDARPTRGDRVHKRPFLAHRIAHGGRTWVAPIQAFANVQCTPE